MDKTKTYPLTERLVTGVKGFETFRSRPYLDPVGVFTWGYGATQGPHPTSPLSEAEADLELRATLTQCQYNVIQEWSKQIVYRGQLDCLTDMLFNVGAGRPAAMSHSGRDGIINLADGNHSKLWAKLMVCDYDGVAVEIPKWCRGGAKVLPGLVKRRAWDLEMWQDKSYAFV